MILRKGPDIRTLPADEDVEAVVAVEDAPPEVGGIFKILIVGILVGIC